MRYRQHFKLTRRYLAQVGDIKKKVEMVTARIALYEESGKDSSELHHELDKARQALWQKKLEVADMISCIPDHRFQWVLMKRYVDLLDWRHIAYLGRCSYQKAISDHGLALPEMQDVLVEAGIIAAEDAEDIQKILDEEDCNDIGTMEDYLKYREEKKRRGVQAS